MGLPGIADGIAATGWVGVEIFFAISGFVLFLPWARGHLEGAPDPATGRFYANRARRILPAYYLNLFIVVVFAVPALLVSAHGLRTIGLHLGFLATLPDRHGGTLAEPIVNAIYWTLAAELCFYALLPHVARWFVGRRWLVAAPTALLLGWAAKLLIIELWGSDDPRSLATAARIFPFVADEFLAGIVLAAIWAELEHRRIEVRPAILNAAFVLGVAGVAAVLFALQSVIGPSSYWRGDGRLGWWPLLTFKPLICGCAALAIFGACWSSTTLFGRIFRLRVLTWLGTISYGLYLWQIPMQKQILQAMPADATPPQTFMALLLGGTVLTVIVAAVSWYGIEKPVLRNRPGPAATTL